MPDPRVEAKKKKLTELGWKKGKEGKEETDGVIRGNNKKRKSTLHWRSWVPHKSNCRKGGAATPSKGGEREKGVCLRKRIVHVTARRKKKKRCIRNPSQHGTYAESKKKRRKKGP